MTTDYCTLCGKRGVPLFDVHDNGPQRYCEDCHAGCLAHRRRYKVAADYYDRNGGCDGCESLTLGVFTAEELGRELTETLNAESIRESLVNGRMEAVGYELVLRIRDVADCPGDCAQCGDELGDDAVTHESGAQLHPECLPYYVEELGR